mmetsp:Transcript_49382/g.117497  ORF Transcript_49382/g.117497 Transcript_49382/m.117497 type:complete len:259 (+) Transcript_49382:62-838(+)
MVQEDHAQEDVAKFIGAASLEESAPAHPKAIITQVIKEDPEMVHISNFVSQEEAEHLLHLAEGRWIRSTVTRGLASELLGEKCDVSHEEGVEAEQRPQASQEVFSERNTSSHVRLGYGESVVVERILARVATVTGYPLENVEKLVMVRYMPGETFMLHHDGAHRPKTVFVYLNDVSDGGETTFPYLGLKVRPKMGTAMMWQNNVPRSDEIGEAIADRRMDHEAVPPADGCIKYGMNAFVSERPQRDCSNIRIVKQGGA